MSNPKIKITSLSQQALDLKETLKMIRDYHQLTLELASKKLKCSKATIYAIEDLTNIRLPSYGVLMRYEEAFTIPVSEIIYISEQIRGEKIKFIPGKAQEILKHIQFFRSRRKYV